MIIGNSVRSAPLLACPGTGGDIKLSAYDRFDPFGFTFCIKLYRTEHAAVISHGNGWHVMLLDLFNKIIEPYGAVKERILGVKMQMNKRHKVKLLLRKSEWSGGLSRKDIFYSD
jgi:hypothetical protein